MVRKIIVLVIGGTVLLLGVVMIALPGPAIVVIPAGLAILATEFLWARRLLQKMKDTTAQVSASVFGKSKEKPPAQREEESTPK
jgi:tellurite resistance protein TerC